MATSKAVQVSVDWMCALPWDVNFIASTLNSLGIGDADTLKILSKLFLSELSRASRKHFSL